MNDSQPLAPWHRESYDRFFGDTFPDMLSACLKLEDYRIEDAGERAIRISLSVANSKGSVSLTLENIPRPDADGVFVHQGRDVVVHPLASTEDLDQATVTCLGEQLADFIEPRLSVIPPEANLDAATLRSWLPLDRWVDEFLDAKAHRAEATNWLSRTECLRRIYVDVPIGGGRPYASGQLGRACPIMTPEGPNLGRILHLARGAAIRDGRIVPLDQAPEMKLSMTAAAIPLLDHDAPNRLLMGANMMRQWLVPADPEPALVQTGTEPDRPEFWCGHNLLTAFLSLGEDTFNDGIVISESCARRLTVGVPVEPGDKVSNRHGTKGVISQIRPDDDMPHLPDGTPIELVYSFIGLHARLNTGQLFEAILGRVAERQGKPIVAPPFNGPDRDEIKRLLSQAGLPETGMEQLKSAANGASLPRPTTVGYVYWGLTHHRVSDKIYSFPAGRFAGQGRNSGKGQLQSELEYFVLRKIQAYQSILEHYNTRSTARPDVPELADKLAAGAVAQAGPPTPAFAEVQRRLGRGGVCMALDGPNVTFAFAPPANPVLELAVAMPHPWLPDGELGVVGAEPDMHEYLVLAEANDKLKRAMKPGTPEVLVASAREALARRLTQYMDALLAPACLSLGYRNRICFAARSVLTPGAGLRTDQLGLPDDLAWALFGPGVVRAMGGAEEVTNRTESATRTLDNVMADSWVILNRAPTLSPTALLAFHPVRTDGKNIRLPVLACAFLDSDFDGDQALVSLPVTEAGQTEAGEKLSVLAHLRRDPSLIGLLCPSQEALWGLADLGLSPEGRERIRTETGLSLPPTDALLGRETLVGFLEAALAREGAETALGLAERLALLGFDAVGRSGASLNAFAQSVVPRTPPPLADADAIAEWSEAFGDGIAARRDYGSDELGPQLMAVKSGARGTLAQLTALLGPSAAEDGNGQLAYVPSGHLDGRAPAVFFASIPAARGVILRAVLGWDELRANVLESQAPKGFSVLSRAMRARRPGTIFARAASTQEVDHLTDHDARLFVGLVPGW